MSGMGWGAEASGQGAFDNIQQLMQTRLLQQQMVETARANMAREKSNDNAAAEQKRRDDATEGNLVAEQIPGGALLDPTDPAVVLLRNTGRGSLITDKGVSAEPPPMLANPAAGPPTDLPGTIANSPSPMGRLLVKGATANQANVQTDNDRAAEIARIAAYDKQADNVRADAAQKSLDAYHTGMVNKKPAGASTLVPVKTKNPITGKTETRFVVKREGDAYESPDSAVTQNRADSALAVNQTGADIIQKLSDPSMAAIVGPALGRYNTVRDFIGDPPPEFAELAGQIESFALANMGVHGMRNIQGADEIKALLDKKHTPESMAAAIRGLMGFSQHFLENAGRTVAPKDKPPAETAVEKYLRLNPQGK